MESPSPGKRHQRSTPDDDVVVGEIMGAWGVSGDLKVAPFTDVPDRFSPGSSMRLDGADVRVVASRPGKIGLLVRLDAVRDRTTAESLHGKLLTVPRVGLPPPPESSYYHYQIIDIDVWTEGGEHLGRVKEILDAGASDVYVVRDEAGGEVLVPSLKSVVIEVTPDEHRMVVRLPEGLA